MITSKKCPVFVRVTPQVWPSLWRQKDGLASTYGGAVAAEQELPLRLPLNNIPFFLHNL